MDLLGDKPDDAPEWVRAYLEEKSKACDQKAKDHARRTAINRAIEVLSRKDGPVSDAATARYRLDGHEVDELRRRLTERVVTQNTSKRVEDLRQSLGHVLATNDDLLRQPGLGRVYEAAVALRLDLQLADGVPEAALRTADAFLQECERHVKDFSARQQDEAARKAQAYQGWALGRIRDYDWWHYDEALQWAKGQLASFKGSTTDIPEMPGEWCDEVKDILRVSLNVKLPAGPLTPDMQREVYSRAAGLTGWNGIDHQLACRRTRVGMERCLFPINVALLELPVAQVYWKAFNKAWEKLNDHPDQLKVAQATATVRKRTLDDTGPQFRRGKKCVTAKSITSP